MDNALSRPAEQYLERLARALWPLASDQREAIVLEIRGHLAGSAAAGRLEEALAGLGSPDALAGHFLDEGADQGGIAPAPLSFDQRPTHSQTLGEVAATWRAGRNGLFLAGAVLVTVLTSTNFLLWLKALRPGITLDVWPMLLVRTAAVLLAMCAVYRLLLTDRSRVWTIDASFFRFAGAMVAVFAGTAAVAVAAIRLGTVALQGAGVEGALLGAARALIAFAALAAAALLLLRVQPWIAALAAGRRGFSLAASWRGSRGRVGSIAKAWAVLVLPLYLFHFLLSLAAVKILPLGVGQLLLAGLDGIGSAAIVLAAAALNATLFRWVSGEPIPAPRPFGTEPPCPEAVEAARQRLRLLLQSHEPLRS